MRKNKMMRLASGLLVAVLLTTSTISGTFAKYVTSDSAKDSARVAKWGVEVATTGSLFAEQYKDAPIATVDDASITVQVAEATTVEQNVVAPGTKNEEGMTFKITGTPEVDTKLTVAVTVNNDIKLAIGKYEDLTTYDDPNNDSDTDYVELTKDYYPVVFTLKNGADKELAKGNLNVIKEFLVGLSGTYNSNTNLATIKTVEVNSENVTTDGTYKLTWEWAYGTAATDITTKNIVDTDRYDTILGNAAVTSITGATTAIDFAIEIMVEQVD